MWRHLVLGTKCAWLHGDPRGFRSRHKRIESHGDYKKPPPPGEHKGLFQYHDVDLRVIVCREFVLKMYEMGIRIIACAASRKHLHALIEIIAPYREMKKIVGRAKQKASHAIREQLPGALWCAGGSYKPIKDIPHLKTTYGYIRTRQDAGTIVWSHNPNENWIEHPEVGIIMMLPRKQQTRIYPIAPPPSRV